MSGLEAVAAVGAIVSAFCAGTKLVYDYRERRKEKKKSNLFSLGSSKPDVSVDSLQSTLDASGPVIQQSYDEGFAKLGQAFAVGDLQCRFELQSQLVTLQQSVIFLLQHALSSNGTYPLNPITAITMSETVRQGTISALAGQYQRMAVAAPIISNPWPVPVKTSGTSLLAMQDPFLDMDFTADVSGISSAPSAAGECDHSEYKWQFGTAQYICLKCGLHIGIPREVDLLHRMIMSSSYRYRCMAGMRRLYNRKWPG